MNYPHDFSDNEEAGFYTFTEDTQLEMVQLRDRLTMYADMMCAPAKDVDDAPMPLSARDLHACFRTLAAEMTRLLHSGAWRPA